MIPLKYAEEQFGTGSVMETRKPLDLIYAAGEKQVDWKKGYDIQTKLAGLLPFKNQMRSLSCTGQAASYYSHVKQILEVMKLTNMTYDELKANQPLAILEHSAKAIYSQVALPGGGAYGSHAMGILTKWGEVTEEKVPSYTYDVGYITTDEKWMTDRKWKEVIGSHLARQLKAKSVGYIWDVSLNTLATAIQENDGVCISVYGSNNKTWRTLTPKPPAENEDKWGHMIYCGAFGEDERGRYIATPNSWGNLGGWQRLYEDYVPFIRVGYTLVDKPSTNHIRVYKPSVRRAGVNIHRDLPMNQRAMIQGFLKSGWTYKKLPNSVI